MALKPLGDRLIVKPSQAEEVTAGGIVLPDSAKEKPQQGEVIAVGPGKLLDNGKTVPMGVSVGETIYYAKYGGTEIKIGADDYVILRQDDVLAILDK
ncbi:MAG: co-chaperone GroES [Chthonomonadales bacterium]|nr:co-chaperone GroES [Chthonomonadales bacterium]